MEYKALHIVLAGNILFADLVKVIEESFNMNLNIINKKGRLEGRGDTELYTIFLVDKEDDLFEEPDEDYLLIIEPREKDYIVENIEDQIKEKLLINKIVWKRGIWIPVFMTESFRELFPE
ncbi:hypothetical protein [Chryseobacterium herbae]|uniref:Uncharacterized protein n=1 Tax=Chryseobacterium herbae TaxID=2976476 RepID=A0ABT2INU5_9FLAO|nr:hypothetical protein [Chryseobacterium sp. pc1-10]MCT2560491.1 hypothetical protein [Chryseobacterium sp. pc1-10]